MVCRVLFGAAFQGKVRQKDHDDGKKSGMTPVSDDEAMTGKYVKNQGNEYRKLHSNHWVTLFRDLAVRCGVIYQECSIKRFASGAA
ncbi:MAG: hypothetical protein DID91_2727702741 [Candidatus Nitrotoga sp. MKT]|nr:MAG: hypothetical protein DID91_2727702741 [Candidatus Nitrotoga sp. MKT]